MLLMKHARVQFYRRSSSYLHNPGKSPLKHQSIGKLLENTAQIHPNRVAIISKYQNRSLTFNEVLNQADKLAGAFHHIGIERGDRVGIWAPNLLEWYLVHMACARGGFVLVNFNPSYQPREMLNLINAVQAKAIVCPKQFRQQQFYQHLLDLMPELKSAEPGRISSKNLPSLTSIVIIDDDQSSRGTFEFEKFMNLAQPIDIATIKNRIIDPQEVAHFQFTSGTTGTPKVPMQSHFQLVNNSYFVGERNEIANQKICVQVPFFHVFGTVVAVNGALHHGATLVLPAPVYSPDKSIIALQQERCSVIYGTPTMYVDLINKLNNKKLDLDVAVSGGAPCSPYLFNQMKLALNVKKVKSIYGLTETTAVVFQSNLDDDDEYHSTGTVGCLQDHLEAKVVDQQGKTVPRGTPGELLMRGYSQTLGYWKNPTKTKELIDEDQWLHTGDQFIIEKDGYGKIVGRIADTIIRGGENIYPKDVEDLLNSHPDILESQVVGIPHERLGEEVCAVLRVKNKVSISLEDIGRHCHGKIAPFNIPSKLQIVKEFPKTMSGKIQKYKIKQSI